MKKSKLFLGVALSFLLLISASVWEGTAAMDDEGFSQNGRFVATNSFPLNTVVDITNLENGIQERFIVSSGLDVPGLLAVFSRDAAQAIDLPARTLVRISMTESPDQTVSMGTGMALLSDPGYNPPAETIVSDEVVFPITDPVITPAERVDSGELIVNLPPQSEIREVPAPVIPDYDELRLITAEERPPEGEDEPAPDYFMAAMIPPLEKSNQAPKEQPPQAVPQAPKEQPQAAPQAAVEQPPQAVPQAVSEQPAQAAREQQSNTVSVPVIQNFEIGKYYLQIGAYRSIDSAKAELSKIDMQLPKAVMAIASSGGPTYRVLIGPLNSGDSTRLLQQYSAIYKDAFVWLGR